MSKKSMRKKIVEEFKRKQQDRIERDRLKFSKEYQPTQEMTNERR